MKWEINALITAILLGVVMSPAIELIVIFLIFRFSGIRKIKLARIIYVKNRKRYLIIKETPEGYYVLRYWPDLLSAVTSGHFKVKMINFWYTARFGKEVEFIKKDPRRGHDIRRRIFKHSDLLNAYIKSLIKEHETDLQIKKSFFFSEKKHFLKNNNLA